MRPRRILIVLAAVVAVVLGVALVAGRDGDNSSSRSPSGLEAQTVSAGEITVRLEPHHVDATGGEFRVSLDTHSEELDMDLAGGARLVVGGTTWPVKGWDGDGPGGHHREGDLRFDAASTATGVMELTLDGFPSAVAARWPLEG